MTVIATSNYKFTDEKIISYIKHDLEGLLKNTKLVSEDGKIWLVLCRIIPFQVSDRIQRFSGETEEFIRYSFQNRLDIEGNLNWLVEQENKQGFQYSLLPFGHSDKPKDGEELTVMNS